MRARPLNPSEWLGHFLRDTRMRYNNVANDSSVRVSLNNAKQYRYPKCQASIASLIEKFEIHPVIFSNPPSTELIRCIIHWSTSRVYHYVTVQNFNVFQPNLTYSEPSLIRA